jgi:RHS repeat-associated protein
MKKFFLLFFVFESTLFSDWDDLFKDDGDPCITHHVNVISGNLQLFSEDAVVDGAVPIHLTRSYSSNGAKDRIYQKELNIKKLDLTFQMEGGWSFFPHLQMLVDPRANSDSHLRVYLKEPSGEMVTYTTDEWAYDNPEIILSPGKKRGPCFGIISSRRNARNNTLYLNFGTGEATLHLANGGKRFYKGSPSTLADKIADNPICSYHRNLRHYLLQKEISPTGTQTIYKYETQNGSSRRILKITNRNPSGTKVYCHVRLEELTSSRPFAIQVTTSDLREIRYEGWSFKNQDYLSFVANGTTILEDISYTQTRKGQGASLKHLKSWGDEKIRVQYYKPRDEEESSFWEKHPEEMPFEGDKVREISQLGAVIASFEYSKGVTDVRDSEGILTRYRYFGDELRKIEYFTENDELYSSQKFIWQDNNLIAKVMCDAEGEGLFSKTFKYDSFGDIVEESFYGNFSGNCKGPFEVTQYGILMCPEKYSKKYEYDPESRLLLSDQESNGLTNRYTYLEGTDLVISKKTYHWEELLITQTFTYDEDHLLIHELTDHGVTRTEKTYTRDPENGRILAVDDGLLETRYTYSPHHEIIQESIYTKDQNLAYIIEYKYNKMGRLISKSEPCGAKNLYKYAHCGDLLSCKEVGKPEITYTYDSFHRPIAATVNNKTALTSYNLKGLINSKTDYLGNTYEYFYDHFGRCVLTIFPEVQDETGAWYKPTMECGYDLMGNPIFCKNSKGEIKKTSYNILSKPVVETFNDGSSILHTYALDGGLKSSILQNGQAIYFTHDVFGRITSKKSALFLEKWTYCPSQLLSYTDQTGLITKYTYDSYGRKISEAIGCRETFFTYDLLGFLSSTQTGPFIKTQICDVEGKVLRQDENNENLTSYTYDDERRKIKVIKTTSAGEAIDRVEYDIEGAICQHTDPLGIKTRFIYENQQKTIIDPEGTSIIETYDALDRLIKKEKKDRDKKTVSIEETFYDRSGNPARTVSHIFNKEQFARTSEIHWEHDFRGLVIKEIRSDKVTHNEYDSIGKLIQRTLPNGVILKHTYDFENRLESLRSSDKTIRYYFYYDKHSSPVKIEDRVNRNEIKREYNMFGELIHESRSENNSLSYTYDELGRKTCLTLPDTSQIHYEYDGPHMKRIRRINPEKKLLYEYTYEKFDTNGHVAEESFICNLGRLTTERDLFERSKSSQSEYHLEEVFYNHLGLVTEVQNSLFGEKNYKYDPLKQLINETGHEYHFDSIGNPTDTKVNDRGELTDLFLYDANGNPTKRIDSNLTYEYDALSRLTQITDSENKSVKFLYDPYSRLLCKLVSQGGALLEKKYYLYDEELEIGSIDSNGTILDLKVLGLGIEADIGAAVAIELNGEPYQPLHDFRGNIIALVSKSGFIVSNFEYNAFGKEDSDYSLNPWRFCSKRNEEGLLYFGKRFYDPSQGRWLTPDPLGTFESVNIYLYTLNSPLNRLDLFGHNSFPTPGFYFEPSKTCNDRNYTPDIRGPPELLICTGILSKSPLVAPVDIVVISGNLHKIRYTPIEIINNRANLLDHIGELASTEEGVIGLITGQPGILTSLNEFVSNSKSLMNSIEETTTYFGLHNQSQGLFKDRSRVLKEELKNRTLTANATQTGLFTGLIADSLGNIQSKSYWLHVPHSEAGLLFNLGHTTLTEAQKNLLQNQLIVFAIAPAEPISWKHCLEATNIYSKKDFVTGPLVKKYINNPDYNISFIPCESPRREFSAYLADHAFLGTTYTNARNEYIKDLRRNYGFHNTNKR